MIFDVRCLGVSLAFFLFSYFLFSIAVARGWRLVESVAGAFSPRRRADLLFALRCLPLVAASVIALGFVLPSFLLLEPRVSSEPVGEVPLTLGACCLLLFAVGIWNTFHAHRKTSQTVANWLKDATAVPSGEAIPVFRIRATVPALTVAGLLVPKVLLSDAAAQVLSAPELKVALRHEAAHVRRCDNLKKLLFHLLGFRGMADLEAAWCEAEEIAADDSAVRCWNEALDLASALIKLSRFARVNPAPALTTALSGSSTASVNARVARLLSWTCAPVDTSEHFPWHALVPSLAVLVSMLAGYGSILHGIHTLTEFLVR